jgi:LysR family hydrogen peroxide-inducible transcriptional activator
MVASGTGMTLMPELACHPTQNAVYRPFTKPEPRREIGLVWRKTSAKKIALQTIVKIIKNEEKHWQLS